MIPNKNNETPLILRVSPWLQEPFLTPLVLSWILIPILLTCSPDPLCQKDYAQRYLYNPYGYVVDNGSYRGNPGRGNVTMPDAYRMNVFRVISVVITTPTPFIEQWDDIGKLFMALKQMEPIYEGYVRQYFNKTDEWMPVLSRHWNGKGKHHSSRLCYLSWCWLEPIPIVPDPWNDFDTPSINWW